MRTFAKNTATLVWLLWCLQAAAFAGIDQCLVCHQTLSDKPSTLFRKDIHHEKGVTCAGCHGGNSDTDDMSAAMDSAAGFIGVPKGDAISRACAKCHSNDDRMKSFGSSIVLHQWETLQYSVHGKMVDAGGNHVVQCITCHDAHGIVRVKSPTSPVSPLKVVSKCSGCHSNATFMRAFNPSLPIDQLEKYRTSVHGTRNAQGDAKAAECASCHGSHGILPPSDVKSQVYPVNLPGTCAHCHSDVAYMKEYGVPTDQFEKFAASVHGVALLQRHDVGAPACNKCHGNHGAAPPGVQSISNVCGTCHVINAELFAASPHKKAFDERKLPECETCHGKHEIVAASNKLLGTSSEAVCSRCHSTTNNPRGFEAAGAMRTLTDSLTSVESDADMLIQDAERKGMEIGAAKFALRDVRQVRMEARTVVHAFDPIRFRQVAEKGLTSGLAVREDARAAIHEFYFRRMGLGVVTLIITVLAVSLYLMIRRIEKRQGAKRNQASVEMPDIH
jgi:predicted CXXCH cytochrome family protein